MRIGICGFYNAINIGDEAILKGIKALLKQVFPESEIVVFGRGMLFSFGFRSFFRAMFKLELWSKPLQALRSCDIFILGGGGLFTDEEMFFVPIFWALHGFAALLLKKPLICLGISVGPLNKLNQVIVKNLFLKAKLIIVRDQRSFELLKKWGIDKVYKTSDLALYLSGIAKNSGREPVDGRKNYIIISARRFRNLDEKLYTILAQFCDAAIAKYGLQIRLIPFQNEAQNDAYVLNKIFEQMQHREHVFVHDFNENIDDLINVFANAELVIGMRLHAGILSLIAGTPFIPLSYMQKVNDFWREFEIELLDIQKLRLDDLLNIFQKIYNNRKEHREKISKIKEKLAKKAKFSEEILSKLLTSSL